MAYYSIGTKVHFDLDNGKTVFGGVVIATPAETRAGYRIRYRGRIYHRFACNVYTLAA